MNTTGSGDDPSRSYATRGGITVRSSALALPYADAVEPVLDALDERRGVLFTSSFEYPGRYTRWDMGFVDPPLAVTAWGREFRIEALNERGEVLVEPIAAHVSGAHWLARMERDNTSLTGAVSGSDGTFAEEWRSRQPSVFSLLRALVDLFHAPQEPYLGLYGAFGYELAFQFEPVRQRLAREPGQRDLVLYLPDEVLIVDHRRETARRLLYEFSAGGRTTMGLPRSGSRENFVPGEPPERECDHAPGEYAATVCDAIAAFGRGDLFEVVPSQTFYAPCQAPPTGIFRRLRARNPAPYGALLNLGEREYLVAASPEMYVRVEGRRIETCPISGTIARGDNAIGDAAQILDLLSSEKETSELTMCTDVDRNDKSRVCVPGTVEVIGRRQIEMYSRLIHTVDHVIGELREGYDALDGFLAHTWAVTVTGAPKHRAIQFIEDHEHSQRRWYGGAMGTIGFDGNMNTGLTLRTVRVADGIAEVRAGATLLHESDPDAEEAETRLKASALLNAISEPDVPAITVPVDDADRPGLGLTVLMIDHEDSFVHTLCGYLRETGARVVTYRWGCGDEVLDEVRPDLVVLSPGPGRPADMALGATLERVLARGLPVFGVCLGLQGIVEHFGGRLARLDPPRHGKPSRVRVIGGRLFEGMPGSFDAGRYHSLHADRATLPDTLIETAVSDDGVLMAVEHRTLPVAAVQFHPESIMSLGGNAGRTLLHNLMRTVADATDRRPGRAATGGR